MTPPAFKPPFPNLVVVRQTDPNYHYARRIANTRFGAQPTYVAYCKNAQHVQYCLKWAQENHFPFRVRSGGHHHEGMSSGNGVLVIDLSLLNTITYLDQAGDIIIPPKDRPKRSLAEACATDGQQYAKAWIGAGFQLGLLYEELEYFCKIIPGGGCSTVNLGGLVQGGGWGSSIRKYGLTCDQLLSCEVVLPNGAIEIISADHKSDLFWALKGGGGGNWGIVTRYCFHLCDLQKEMSGFTLNWETEEGARAILKKWAALHVADALPRELSTFCRLFVAKASPEDAATKSVVYARMGGKFYGSEAKLNQVLEEFFGKELINQAKERQLEKKKQQLKDKFRHLKILNHRWLDHQKQAPTSFKSTPLAQPLAKLTKSIASMMGLAADDIAPVDEVLASSPDCPKGPPFFLPPAPQSSCDRPHPHKVTSGYPKDDLNHDVLIDFIYDYLAQTCFYPDVSRYMSFHCLGGAVRDHAQERAFAFSKKPYLLQLQSWWDDAGNLWANTSRNEDYVKWVDDFRKAIHPYLEGAFINFVDQHLVPNPNTPEGRLDLLKIYYGENMARLRTIKRDHDPNNWFQFPMSIPPAVTP